MLIWFARLLAHFAPLRCDSKTLRGNFLRKVLIPEQPKYSQSRPGIRLPNPLTVRVVRVTKTTCLLRKHGAGGGTRTRTELSLQRILSPLCLPFHHPGSDWTPPPCNSPRRIIKDQQADLETAPASEVGRNHQPPPQKR